MSNDERRDYERRRAERRRRELGMSDRKSAIAEMRRSIFDAFRAHPDAPCEFIARLTHVSVFTVFRYRKRIKQEGADFLCAV